MNGPATAREALIAEAIGDLAKLLDRAEAVQKELVESRRDLTQASTQLANQVAAFDVQMTAVTENAKLQVVQHIVARTDASARRTLETQTQVMTEAAQKLFRTEVGPTLHQMAEPLRQLAERLDHPWVDWLTHAATAACASAITLFLTLHFLVR